MVDYYKIKLKAVYSALDDLCADTTSAPETKFDDLFHLKDVIENYLDDIYQEKLKG
jgi:hypothetical protein